MWHQTTQIVREETSFCQYMGYSFLLATDLLYAGMSDQCSIGFEHDTLIEIQLREVRAGANSDFHVVRSVFQSGRDGSPH